jgi:inosine/xanthosine triphosphatase
METINVGTKNLQKIDAVKEVLKEYIDFKDCKIIGIEVSSDVSEQPKSIDETIKGAINRAKNCFTHCNYSIGLESGLIKVPYTKTGYMDVTACAIFDGKKIHLGLSSAFEYPIKVTKSVFEDNINITQSFMKHGLTKDPKMGSAEGAIGLLTKGKVTRKDYTKQSIHMAMIHLENPELY